MYLRYAHYVYDESHSLKRKKSAEVWRTLIGYIFKLWQKCLNWILKMMLMRDKNHSFGMSVYVFTVLCNKFMCLLFCVILAFEIISEGHTLYPGMTNGDGHRKADSLHFEL